MSIAKFYEGQDVFITGGSGFVGKPLICKLLQSCSGVRSIYVLLRGKKGKSASERLRELFKDTCFRRLNAEQPEALQKVKAIDGDISELRLGIGEADLAKMQNVSIILHSAATVRFDECLRSAININMRGTHELIKIAETLKNLKAFVHVSTGYCNSFTTTIEEKVYPPKQNWRDIMKLAETNIETLNIFEKKLLKFFPHTYAFTKHLAEQIINDYRDKLPLAIVRPTIVSGSVSEPEPGWIDNFNGQAAVLFGCGLGIMGTVKTNPDFIPNFVPVDICVRSIIIASYQIGLGARQRRNEALKVVNCAAGLENGLTFDTGLVLFTEYVLKHPFENAVWKPGSVITNSRSLYWIKCVTIHLIFSILMDTLAWINGQKPRLVKLHRKTYIFGEMQRWFYRAQWIFPNDNFLALESSIPSSEIKEFSIMAIKNPPNEEYFMSTLRGLKQLLPNEPEQTSKAAYNRLKLFAALDFTTKLIVKMWLIREISSVTVFLLSYFLHRVM